MGNSITRLASVFRVAAGTLTTTVNSYSSNETGSQPATVTALSEVNLSPHRPTRGENALKSRSLFIVPARRLNAPKDSSCARDSKGFVIELPYVKSVEEAARRKYNWKNKPVVKEIGQTQLRRRDSYTSRWSVSRQRTLIWEKQFQRREAIQKLDTYITRDIARKLMTSPDSRAAVEGHRQQTSPRENIETTPSRKRQHLDLDAFQELPEVSEPVDHKQEKRAKVSVEMTAAGSVCSPPGFPSLEIPPSGPPPRVIPMMRTFPSVPMPILKRLKQLVRLARRRRRFLNSLEVEWPDLMQIDPLSPTGINVTMSAEGDQAGVIVSTSPWSTMEFQPGSFTQFEAVFNEGDHLDLEMLDASDGDIQSEIELPMAKEAFYGSLQTENTSSTWNSFSDIQMFSDPLTMPETVSLLSTCSSMDSNASEKLSVRVKESFEADNGPADTELESEDQCDSDEDEDESSFEDEDIGGGSESESGGLDDSDDASSEENTKEYTPHSIPHPKTPTATEKMMDLLYGAADDVPDEEELRQLEADAEDENEAYLFTQYEKLCRETLGE